MGGGRFVRGDVVGEVQSVVPKRNFGDILIRDMP